NPAKAGFKPFEVPNTCFRARGRWLLVLLTVRRSELKRAIEVGIERPKRVRVIFFITFHGLTLLRSGGCLSRTIRLAVVLNWRMFEASTLVRVVRHISKMINRLSCWGTHRRYPSCFLSLNSVSCLRRVGVPANRTSACIEVYAL